MLPQFGQLCEISQQQGFLFQHIWTQQYNILNIKLQKKATKLNFDSVLVVIAFLQNGQVIETGEDLKFAVT